MRVTDLVRSQTLLGLIDPPFSCAGQPSLSSHRHTTTIELRAAAPFNIHQTSLCSPQAQVIDRNQLSVSPVPASSLRAAFRAIAYRKCVLNEHFRFSLRVRHAQFRVIIQIESISCLNSGVLCIRT